MVPENWHICVNKGITYLLKAVHFSTHFPVDTWLGVVRRTNQFLTACNLFNTLDIKWIYKLFYVQPPMLL